MFKFLNNAFNALIKAGNTRTSNQIAGVILTAITYISLVAIIAVVAIVALG